MDCRDAPRDGTGGSSKACAPPNAERPARPPAVDAAAEDNDDNNNNDDDDDDDDDLFALLWRADTGAPAGTPPRNNQHQHQQQQQQAQSREPPGARTSGRSTGPAGPDSGASAAAAAKAVIMDACRRAFAMVEERPEDRWARDFLLDDSPHTAAALVTNPTALLHSVSLDFLDRSFENNDTHAGMFDGLIDFSGVFVPSFAAGHLIVGVAIGQNAISSINIGEKTDDLDPALALAAEKLGSATKTQSPFGALMLGTGRYVRDTRNGSLLILVRDKSVAAGSAPHMCFAHFRLLSTTKAERTDIVCREPLYKSGRILESVIFCTTGMQSRFCPICAAQPCTGCSCQLPMYRPAHSLDFARDMVAMQRYHGDYLGNLTAVAALPPEEANCSSPVVGIRYAFASLVTSMRFSGQSSSNARHKELLALFQTFAVQLSISSSSPMCTAMPSSDEPYGGLVPSSLKVLPADAVLRKELLGISLTAGSDHVNNVDDEIDLASTAIARVTQCQTPPAASEAPADSNVDDRCSIMPGSNNPAEAPKTAAPDPNSSSCDEPVGGELTDEAKVRDLRRIMRNRASAARSNARKKERTEALKRELIDISRKAAELRKKETELRAENVLIRRRLRGQHSLHDHRPSQGTHRG